MKTIVQTFQSLQLYWFRTLKRYREKIKPVNICETVRTAKSVLFCLPDDAAMIGPAQQLVSQFISRHSAWQSTLVGKSTAINSSRSDVVTFSSDDMTFYGKPKRALMERVAKRKFDLAIDLSIPFDFTNLVMIWNIDANLRVGFYELKREDFFSFLFRQHPNTRPEQAYQELLKHLEVLM